MPPITETSLPGVGTRFEFTSAAGQPIGVVVRRDGDRDILVYDREDPDRCAAVLHLRPDEATALIDLLGGSAVVARHQETLRQSLEGIELEWVRIPAGARAAGRTIGETMLRRSTGASIVSVLRGTQWETSPHSDFRIEAGDTVVLVGAADAVAQAAEILTGA